MPPSLPPVTGLLLAAGAGRRMGMPKALVETGGVPWVRRAVDVLLAGGCASVTVVVGASADRVRHLLDDAGHEVDLVACPTWARGMGESLRTGLHAVAQGDDAEAAMVHLVDLPDVGPDVVRRVLRAYDGGTTLARAAYAGAPGHPVLLGRDHWTPVAELATGDRGAREYLRAHRPALVECGDLAGGADVDAPVSPGPPGPR